MSFGAFCQNRNGANRIYNRNYARCGSLRQRLYDEREFAQVSAPTTCGFGTQALFDSYPSSVCMINRPLCGLVEPALGGYPQLYGNYPETFGPGDYGGRGHHYGRHGGGVLNSGLAVGYNYYGRGGAGGWQQIGYLLPLHVEPARNSRGVGHRQCTCSARFKMHGRQSRQRQRRGSRIGRQGLRQPSQFQSGADYGHDALEPYDAYKGVHEEGCALYAQSHNECNNRQCGVRRYHLYVRVDPDRLGQQCLYTSSRRGDHRYNNCRYLQFGVSEEGLHDSAIMILSRDFIIDGSHQRLASSHASKCLEDGDITFVPGERNKKFRVNLYDDRIYDGNCYY